MSGDGNMTAMMTQPRTPHPPSGHRVLIVEDDASTRWVLCALMRRMGYICQAAADGREALVLVDSFAPEAILMDLMMPGLDGIEVTRRLKSDAQTRGIPVLVLTSNITPSGISAARQAGCDDLLAKPVNLDELVDRLEKLIDADRR
jgi:CheY-like chemotaxis protein